MSSTVGRPDDAATPSAEDTMPSMPLAPRLASTRSAMALPGANASTSRMGMLLDTKRFAPDGSAATTSRATRGSVSSGCSANAASSALRAWRSAWRKICGQRPRPRDTPRESASHAATAEPSITCEAWCAGSMSGPRR